MHPICSWMHAIDLHDEIEIQALDVGDESSYKIFWDQDGKRIPVEWSVEQDLAVCAHKAIESEIGRALPIRLRVAKRIPAGGGLGGGSADAATVLRGLNQLFDLKLDQKQVCEIASSLGSDIPFFVESDHEIVRPAIVEGFGEQITRFDTNHSGTPITLFFPNFGCPTSQVYRAFDLRADHDLDSDRVRSLVGSSQLDTQGLFNDLSQAAIEVVPVLSDIKQQIEDVVRRRVHVSGSGSTLFMVGDVDIFALDLDFQAQLGIKIVQSALI